MALNIKICPTCGSNRIKRVRRSLKREYNGQPYSVPNVDFFECPRCGEKLFGQAAMDKIQSYSPAFARPARGKRVRRAG
jgi:YgiT-type zinc finger domain-containing protein